VISALAPFLAGLGLFFCVLRENPDLPAKAQELLFATTILFERIVWLARRSTLLLSASGAETPG
jgi:hypothetical protein